MTSSSAQISTSANRSGRTRVIVISAAALLLVAGGIFAITRGESDSDQSASNSGTKAPDIVQARQVSFEISTTAVGELEARKNVEIRSPLEEGSSIVSIVDEGSLVKAGDLLVQLNSDPIKTRVDEETLRVETARAELVAAQNQYDIQVNENASRLRDAKLKVELAVLALRQWEQGDLKKKRQSLDLEISRATMELDRLAEKLVNSEEVYAAGYMSKDERDRDEVLYIQAIAASKDAWLALYVYESYEIVAERKQKISGGESAVDELQRVKLDNDIELASKLANLNNRRTSLNILGAKLTKLSEQLVAATIKAPQDGLVVYGTSLERGGWGGRSEGPLQIGQQVQRNQLLMILPDTSAMVASVRVQESLAGRVRQGQPVLIKIDAAGGKTFSGSVESIGVMAESGGWRDPNLREYTVRVAIDADGVDLKPAMRAEARIILGSVNDAITVPVQAVFNDGPVQYVFIPRGGRFTRVPVRLGRRSDTLAEVRAGLNVGDSVLLRQPMAGEMHREPWNEAQLTLAGYSKDQDGQIITVGGPAGGSMTPGGRNIGGGAGGPGGGGSSGGEGRRPREGGTSGPAAARAGQPGQSQLGQGQPGQGQLEQTAANSSGGVPTADAKPLNASPAGDTSAISPITSVPAPAKN